MTDDKDVRKMVREGYTEIAEGGSSCCAPKTSCCDPSNSVSTEMGYSIEELASVPVGADLGLGCGNPVALASLKPGEVVMDLGSGPGLDSFLASKRVGPDGKVIGVDMTQAMLDKARENAKQGGFDNVEFRLGEIENIPSADGTVDVIISNCVINLSPDKERVFREAFRVLKSGGRLMVSDIALLGGIPDAIRDSVAAYVGCLAGAVMKDDYLKFIEEAGFSDIEVVGESSFTIEGQTNTPTEQLLEATEITSEQIAEFAPNVVSIKVSAVKL